MEGRTVHLNDRSNTATTITEKRDHDDGTMSRTRPAEKKPADCELVALLR